MTRTHPLLLIPALLALGLSLVTASAPPALAAGACYADYKAKRDKPYELHYGVMEVSSCDRQQAAEDARGRLARNGWTLLNIVSVFDESGLAGRKSDAGPYYLRF
ncbi:hypothetical protein [Pseudooceanicola spongiae]|jgi:hypothetical protein|uniref:DUF4177 domain-containing protein n=1 Tax=Pseudooceanicola spongiae TaxID=2613965 RepID=A0A7L9WN69_9RHOB|nr:hypothetical protein [Pseudooceanicola spongiae]QOL81831.1 hypothetical protein F3W81_13960 [Pseudooceanicola spongiae]